jgi:hypothetical protein
LITRAKRGAKRVANASPGPSFALGALSHRSNRENVNKLRIDRAPQIRREKPMLRPPGPAPAFIVSARPQKQETRRRFAVSSRRAK